MHRPSPRLAVRVLLLAASLGLSVAPASYAAPARASDPGLARPAAGAIGSPWSAWLEVWSPIAAWFAADELTDPPPDDGTGGTTTGGTGGTGGLGPGSGGGVADPSG
jgi:hypothetical protein